MIDDAVSYVTVGDVWNKHNTINLDDSKNQKTNLNDKTWCFASLSLDIARSVCSLSLESNLSVTYDEPLLYVH